MQRLHQEFRDVQDTGEKHALSSLLLHFFCFFYFPNIIHLHVGDSGGNNLRKTSKKNSISLLSFLSAASSLIPVVFLFLFTKRKILFSIFFSIPSRRVQRGVIKHAPFFFSPFLFSISFVVRRWNLPWLFRASPNVVLTFRKAKISQTDVLRRRGFYKQGDRLLRGER